MAESSNRFIVLDNPTKKYIQKQQNKKTRAKTRATNVLKKANMPWALSTIKSFTTQGNVCKLEANDLQKRKARETNQRNWSDDKWRGKHSLRKIFTLSFWRSDKVLALRRNKSITWPFLYRLEGENPVEGENLTKCFVLYLRTRCFCIRKLTRSLR